MSEYMIWYHENDDRCNTCHYTIMARSRPDAIRRFMKTHPNAFNVWAVPV